MPTLEEKREKFKNNLQYLNEEQLDFLDKLTNLGSHPNKIDRMKLSGYDLSKTFDSSYPEPYMKSIAEMYPGIRQGTFIFDYSDKKIFGELVNVNDLLANKLLETFKL